MDQASWWRTCLLILSGCLLAVVAWENHSPLQPTDLLLCTHPDVDSKFCPNLQAQAQAQPLEDLYAWVQFVAKENCGPTTSRMQWDQRDSVNPPSQHDYQALLKCPVISSHRSAIAALGAHVRTESRWRNAVSVKAPLAVLREIAQLAYVSQISLQSLLSSAGDSQAKDTQQSSTFASWNQKYQQKSQPNITRNSRAPPNSEASLRDERFLGYGKSYSQLAFSQLTLLHQMGVTGAGQKIAVMGSGFDTRHKVFANIKIAGQQDFVLNLPTAEGPSNQDNIHGTAALSVLAGANPGVMYGAAFEADYLLARVYDVFEDVHPEDIFVSAVEWAEAMGASLIVSLLNFSGGVAEPDFSSHAVVIASTLNIVVVASVGDQGKRGILPPSDAQPVISVGGGTLDGMANPSSSVGPTHDGRLKPEVLNVGAEVYSAQSDETETDMYKMDRGSGLATALTAGAVALIRQTQPLWTPPMVKEAILRTAQLRSDVDNSSFPPTRYGFGFVRALDASKWQFSECETRCENGSCAANLTNSICTCKPNFFGFSCFFTTLPCESYCNTTTGSCTNNRCICNRSYYGSDCSVKESTTRPPLDPGDSNADNDLELYYSLGFSSFVVLLACSSFCYFRANQGQEGEHS